MGQIGRVIQQIIKKIILAISSVFVHAAEAIKLLPIIKGFVKNIINKLLRQRLQ